MQDQINGAQQDIELEPNYEKPYREDINLASDDGFFTADIRRTVIEHSPDGFSWGYMGSGPADLALNILNAYIPPRSDGRDPVRMYVGVASETAARLHQDFKALYVATMPEKGGKITRQDVEIFLLQYNMELTDKGVEVYAI